MVRLIELVSFSALLALSTAGEDGSKRLTGLTKVAPKPGFSPRSDLQKRCQGTCSECFGAGYIECPNDSYYCYLPGDSTYGLDSCSSDGSSGSYTSSAPASTSTGSAGNSDLCTEPGATCVSCFGAGYIDCPDGQNCYNPDDPQYDTCPGDSGSSGSGGSGGTSSSSCESQYGSGSVPCGDDACYNPGDGEVCCADGYHCEGGDTCSTVVGKCCPEGSTASGCEGGSGSGGLSSTASSNSYSSYSFATSTDDGLSSPTSGSEGSSSTTGSSLISGSSGSGAGKGVTVDAVKVVGVVLGGLVGGMMLL